MYINLCPHNIFHSNFLSHPWYKQRYLLPEGIKQSGRSPKVVALFLLQLQYIPRNLHTVFALLCFVVVIHWLIFPISIKLTSLALWQSNDCPSASKATLMNMDKYFMWIHYARLHNHNKAKHNKTVCIFLGIYCISSNMIWFLQLHDTIKMKSNHTGINYNHNNIAIRNPIMIYNSVQNLIFATKFSSIYLAKGERRLVFQVSFVNLQRAKDNSHMFDAKYRYVFVV